jgi:hypothetical protein
MPTQLLSLALICFKLIPLYFSEIHTHKKFQFLGKFFGR